MTDALFWLTLSAIATVLFSLPYTVERIFRVGFWDALGYSDYGIAGFVQPNEQPAVWARRAHAAHRNALESLPALAALILTAHVAGVGDAFVALAAQSYFYARLAYYFIYIAGIPILRTLLYIIGFTAIFAIAFHVLGYI